MSVLTLALAVKFFVPFSRLLSTISSRSGLVTLKVSFISSSLEGSLDKSTAMVCVRALSLVVVFQWGINVLMT